MYGCDWYREKDRRSTRKDRSITMKWTANQLLCYCLHMCFVYAFRRINGNRYCETDRRSTNEDNNNWFAVQSIVICGVVGVYLDVKLRRTTEIKSRRNFAPFWFIVRAMSVRLRYMHDRDPRSINCLWDSETAGVRLIQWRSPPSADPGRGTRFRPSLASVCSPPSASSQLGLINNVSVLARTWQFLPPSCLAFEFKVLMLTTWNRDWTPEDRIIFETF